jgi:hypothetical protein
MERNDVRVAARVVQVSAAPARVKKLEAEIERLKAT